MFSLKSFLFSGGFTFFLPPLNWSHRMFLFWSALPILREAHCAWSVAWFQCNCYTLPVSVTAHEVELNIIFSICISLALIPSGPAQELRARHWSHSVRSFQSRARDIITGARNLFSGQGCSYWSKLFFHYNLLFPKLLQREGLSSYAPAQRLSMERSPCLLQRASSTFLQWTFHPIDSSRVVGLHVLQREAAGFHKHLFLSPFYPGRS